MPKFGGSQFEKKWKKTMVGASGHLERGTATKAEARRWFNYGMSAGQSIEMSYSARFLKKLEAKLKGELNA
jgi:hypothetical protein